MKRRLLRRYKPDLNSPDRGTKIPDSVPSTELGDSEKSLSIIIYGIKFIPGSSFTVRLYIKLTMTLKNESTKHISQH